MLRKLMMALVAVTAIGATLAATDADARWRGGGGWHGGWHGGWRGGGWGWRGSWGPRFYGVYPYYGYPYYAYPAGYGCYRTVRVGTRYGIRYRRIWVCG